MDTLGSYRRTCLSNWRRSRPRYSLCSFVLSLRAQSNASSRVHISFVPALADFLNGQPTIRHLSLRGCQTIFPFKLAPGALPHLSTCRTVHASPGLLVEVFRKSSAAIRSSTHLFSHSVDQRTPTHRTFALDIPRRLLLLIQSCDAYLGAHQTSDRAHPGLHTAIRAFPQHYKVYAPP